MEIFNTLRKNGCTKGITAWTFIYLLSFEFPWVIGDDGDSMTFSSGMDEETTTNKESSTFISLTPFLSTRPTTSSPISPTISTDTISSTFKTSNATVFLSSASVTTVQTESTTASTEATTASTEATTVITVAPPTCEGQSEFLASGASSGDKVFPKGDDNFSVYCPSIEVPINSKNLGCFYISTNGYVTNGDLLPYSPSKSVVDKTKITLIPFWADIDTRTYGTVYYQVVDIYNTQNKIQTETNRQAIKTFFARYEANFNPIWALKVTWSDVVPFQFFNKTEAMTFQMILATDGTITYMAYIYDECKSTWQDTRSAIMGFSYPGYKYYNRDSLTGDIFDLGKTGNTASKKKGIWIFELSKQYSTNYALKCLEWAETAAMPILPFSLLTISCPCTLWQARRDIRFSRGPNGCYYLTFPSFGYSKVCCYTRNARSRRLRSLRRGNLQEYSAILSRKLWKKNDRLPFKYCCLKSDYCSLYNQYRTEDFCENYIPLTRRFMFGDPHIQTLDGYTYTFNGLGEFELLNIYNTTNSSDVLMKIQCRTKVVGTNGNQATVFSGFVIESEGVKVQINMRENTADVEIFGDDDELTTFYTDNDYTWTKEPFTVSHNTEKNDSYIIRHTSQSMMEITLDGNLLLFSINVGYDIDNITTDGLLGTYNKNSSDDLQTPKGDMIPTTSTEEEIYYKFGLLWKVNNSIFHYENGETQADYNFPTFIPTFLTIDNTSAEYKKALEVCAETETDCIYDYLITKDVAVAASTKEIEQAINFNKELATYTSPVFNGTRKITVNVNQKLVHIVPVTSENGNLELEVIGQENCNVSLVNKEVQISVELNQVIPVKASFQVSNSYNMSTSLFNLTAMICPFCHNNGVCNTSIVNPSRNYEYVCECEKGWRGTYCEIDGRCDPLGCPCNGTATNYTCDCPEGYRFEDKCTDIDECSANPGPCSQTCTNTVGSYKCSCNAGYTLVNGTECIDIDECALNLNDCDQKCTNTQSSYVCSCYPGYIINGTTACIKDGTDICNGSSINCSMAEGCTKINNKAVCFCKSGYAFNDTTKMCEDIDECASITCIDGQCENTEGSYVCKCPVGKKLANDGRTCEECGQNKWGENCANTCSGANCIECNKMTGCVCSTGYTGTTCETDINECLTADYCNTTFSVCQNSIGSALCVCKSGFTPNGTPNNCENTDECAALNDCSDSATCIDTYGSYKCKCNTGYEGDGKNCTDIDECATNAHNCDQNCVNQEGSFACTCNGGYKLQDNRISCKKVPTLNYEDRLYIIIGGSLAGLIVAGILITLWCYFFGCGCRRRRDNFIPTLGSNGYYLHGAFGSLSSTLTGKLGKDPLMTDSARAAKYLEDWGNFSPYSENNRQESGTENLGWEDFGESSSSWGNVFNNLDNSQEFRIERPQFRP